MNQKGFTMLELIISFALVSVITLTMFNVVVEYKNRQSLETVKSDLTMYKYKITKLMQDDFQKIGIKDVVINNNIATITLKDDTIKTLIIDDANYSISYDDITYKLPKINRIKMTLDNPLKLTNKTSGITTDYNFFQINVNIGHMDLTKDYGIHITVPIYYEKLS